MDSSENQLAIPSKKVSELVPFLTVIIEKGVEVQVPLTADNNLLLSQVRVARLRQVLDKQLVLMKGASIPMKPADLKSFVDSYLKTEEAGRFAYAPGLSENEGGESVGKAAAQVAKAMAEGFATAGHKAVADAKEDRRAKILGLGKDAKQVKPIIIEEEKVTQEAW